MKGRLRRIEDVPDAVSTPMASLPAGDTDPYWDWLSQEYHRHDRHKPHVLSFLQPSHGLSICMPLNSSGGIFAADTDLSATLPRGDSRTSLKAPAIDLQAPAPLQKKDAGLDCLHDGRSHEGTCAGLYHDTYRPGSEPRPGPFNQSANGTVIASRSASSAIATNTISPQRPVKRAWECDHEGCSHAGTFSRDWELQRHKRQKHDGAKQMPCPVAGCFKGTHQTSFARSDKLTAYLRSCGGGVRLACPSDECSDQLWDPDLLWVHIQKAHAPRRQCILEPHMAAILNAVSPVFQICPWWACRKAVPEAKYSDHLSHHPQEQLSAMTPGLVSRNYLPVKPGCQHSADTVNDASLGQCCCPVTAIHIICPVCKTVVADHAAFVAHLDVHLIQPDLLEHFQAWQAYARSMDVWVRQTEFSALNKWGARKIVSVQCPSCGWSWTSRERYEGGSSSHHFETLADPEMLRLYRREILRLYPGFINFSVWDDLAHPLRDEEAESSAAVIVP